MPSAGVWIATVRRAAGFAGQPCSPRLRPFVPGTDPDVGPGPPRLSQATIAFPRRSHCQLYETPAAPYECPACPISVRLSSRQNGLYAVSRPPLTRRNCLAAWLVPVEQLGTGR